MADKVTKSTVLEINLGFVDNDTRLIKLKDPKGSITATQIHELSTFIKTNNFFIGDKYGADTKGILTAEVVEETRVVLDPAGWLNP